MKKLILNKSFLGEKQPKMSSHSYMAIKVSDIFKQWIKKKKIVIGEFPAGVLREFEEFFVIVEKEVVSRKKARHLDSFFSDAAKIYEIARYSLTDHCIVISDKEANRRLSEASRFIKKIRTMDILAPADIVVANMIQLMMQRIHDIDSGQH